MADKTPRYGEFGDGKLWFQRKGTVITLGLTDAAIDDLGQIETIEFPDEGSDYTKGEVVMTLEGSRGTLHVKTPAAGVIEGINEAAQGEPTVVSDDPLEAGWLCTIEMDDPTDLDEFQGADFQQDADSDDDEDFDDDEDDEDDDSDDDDFDEDDLDDDEDSDDDDDADEDDDLDDDSDDDFEEEDDEDEAPKKGRGKRASDDGDDD